MMNGDGAHEENGAKAEDDSAPLEEEWKINCHQKKHKLKLSD
jgi:hypothetical protein